MIKTLSKVLSLGLFSLFFQSVNAATLNSINDLPVDIQTCILAGTCTAGLNSIDEYNGAQMYNYYDLTSRAGSKLIRYSLTNAFQLDNDVASDLTGYLWLMAADNFDMSNSIHNFSLYLDHVNPAPIDMSAGYNSNPTTIDLGLTSADLLAGTGFRAMSGISSEPLLGELETTGLAPVVCLDSCEDTALFNIVYLQYFNDGSLLQGFNPLDARSALYLQTSDYYDLDTGELTFSQEQMFSVQAVPVPAAVWLFGSGLLGLIGVARSRKS